MAIEIKEEFAVAAPIARVWDFLVDPKQVVNCMPGAQLDEVVDAENFLGRVSVKLGAVGASYKGKVRFVRVDETEREVEMSAQGREAGGGTAKAKITTRLTETDGGTDVCFEAKIDLTGKIIQVGRGMIQGVSHQLFEQFAAQAKTQLEVAPATEEGASSMPPVVPAASNEIRVLPLLLQTLTAAISRFVRKLFGRATPER